MTITKTELEIMEYIWSANCEITPKNIREHFSYKHWSKQTVSTYLRNLVSSGFLNMRKISPSKYYYSAAITKEEYNLIPTKKIIGDIFKGSYTKFFCSIIDNKISQEEFDKLENMIKQKRQEFLLKEESSENNSK